MQSIVLKADLTAKLRFSDQPSTGEIKEQAG